jgi:hypothetical protein
LLLGKEIGEVDKVFSVRLDSQGRCIAFDVEIAKELCNFRMHGVVTQDLVARRLFFLVD